MRLSLPILIITHPWYFTCLYLYHTRADG